MRNLVCLLALGLSASIRGAELPELKIEATDGGSALVIRNPSSTQALTAYLVELVDYPGSSFAFAQDELALGGEPLAAGQQRRIPIGNMTVGAAPDYVKMIAAIYADGSSAGPAEKVAQIVERRRLYLTTIRDLIARIGKGDGSAALQKSADAIPESTSKTKRAMPAVLNPGLMKALTEDVAKELKSSTPAAVTGRLKKIEAALLSSKPAL